MDNKQTRNDALLAFKPKGEPTERLDARLSALARKNALKTLRAARTAIGFNELMAAVGNKAKPLSALLSALTSVGYMERRVTNRTPKRTSYQTTTAGRRALEIVGGLA